MKMKSRRALAVALATGVAVLSGVAITAAAETYPDRPIDIIVPWGPGGGIDTFARKIASPASPILGVALPVSNVPGATGMVGMAKVAGARANGYTVAAVSVDFVTSIASGKSKTGMDDYVWLCRTQLLESYLFVSADSPFRTIQDLLAHAKANPKKLKVAIVGFGSPDDIALRYLASKGYEMIPSPQPKPGERYAATLGNHADVLYEQAGDVRQFILAKQLRPLMVFSEKRSAAFPDVPSSKELGLDIFLPQWRGLLVRAGTPASRVQKLANAFQKAAESEEWKAFQQSQYADPDSFMGPDVFGKWARGEYDTFLTLMKRYGMVKTN